MATAQHPEGPDPTTSKQRTFTIGTRKSALARKQTDIVKAKLTEAYPQHAYKVHGIDPLGDRNQVTALYEFNAKSLWTHELEELLLDKSLEAVVHSLKDMPTQLPATLALGSIFKREDPRDVVVLKQTEENKSAGVRSAHEILSSLPKGSIVGTSSLRRIAQLKRKFPHITFGDVRGNIATRLRKLDDPASFTEQEIPQFSCLILAAAGLLRLDLGDRISAYLSSKDGGVLHAVGQGALGVEVRADDAEMLGMLKELGDFRSERVCLAERSLMRTLEGGCSVPIGVETEWVDETSDELIFRAVVVSLDGSEAVEVVEQMTVRDAAQADEFGWKVAQKLVEGGAAKILENINLHRSIIEEQGNA